VVGGDESWGWIGREPGASTVTVEQDLDEDGAFEPGEPSATLGVQWQRAPRDAPPEGAQVLPVFSEEPAAEPAEADAPPADDDPSGSVVAPGGGAAGADGSVLAAGAAPARAASRARSAPGPVRVGRVARAGRSGLRVFLRCPRGRSTACRGTLTVWDRTGRRRLGSARFRVAPGRARVVRTALRARPRVVRVSVGPGRGALRRPSR
jgi:hypothetical protein